MSQKLEAEVLKLEEDIAFLRSALIVAFKEKGVSLERIEQSLRPQQSVEEIAKQILLSGKAAPDEAEQHRELIRKASLDLVPNASALIGVHGEKI